MWEGPRHAPGSAQLRDPRPGPGLGGRPPPAAPPPRPVPGPADRCRRRPLRGLRHAHRAGRRRTCCWSCSARPSSPRPRCRCCCAPRDADSRRRSRAAGARPPVVRLRRTVAPPATARVATQPSAQAAQAQRGHPLGVRLGDPGEHPADLGEVEAVRDPAHQHGRQRVPVGDHPLGLRQGLAHQPPRPQREPPAHARIGVDRGTHLLHGEAARARCRRARPAPGSRVSASSRAATSR